MSFNDIKCHWRTNIVSRGHGRRLESRRLENMRIYTYNNYNPKWKNAIKPIDIIRNNFGYLNEALSSLNVVKPELIPGYIKAVKKRLLEDISDYHFNTSIFNITEFLETFPILKKDSELLELIITFTAKYLELADDYKSSEETVKRLQLKIAQAQDIFSFHRTKALIDLLGRKDGIQFIKDFTDYYVLNFRDVTKYDNLTKIFEDDIERGNSSDSSIFISALINEGKYVGKCLKCMGHEAMKMLPDNEITELVLCYSDYSLIRKMNDYFDVTRNITLNTGSYCDLCVHDTRIVDEIVHPTREFYDNLGN